MADSRTLQVGPPAGGMATQGAQSTMMTLSSSVVAL